MLSLTQMLPNSLPQSTRGYLGMSQIHTKCELQLWNYIYKKDYVSQLPLQHAMLFDIGNSIESQILNALSQTPDVKILQTQTQLQDEKMPWFKGHIDALIESFGEQYVLEIKSMSDKQFNFFKDNGAAKSHPAYIAQVQLYMHYLKVPQAILLAVNKEKLWKCNRDDYLHQEYLQYDSKLAQQYIDKAKRISELKESALTINKGNCFFCPFQLSCTFYNSTE